ESDPPVHPRAAGRGPRARVEAEAARAVGRMSRPESRVELIALRASHVIAAHPREGAVATAPGQVAPARPSRPGFVELRNAVVLVEGDRIVDVAQGAAGHALAARAYRVID